MAALDRFRPIAAQVPVGLTRSALFGAMAKHFGLPASELETALRSKAPPPVKAAPKPVSKVPDGPPPDQLESSWMAAILKDRRLLAKDEFRVADELKHMGLRHLVAALQSGGSPEDALYESGGVDQGGAHEVARHVAGRRGLVGTGLRLRL